MKVPFVVFRCAEPYCAFEFLVRRVVYKAENSPCLSCPRCESEADLVGDALLEESSE